MQLAAEPQPLLLAGGDDPLAAPREEADLEQPVPDHGDGERDRDRQDEERHRAPRHERLAGEHDRQRQQERASRRRRTAASRRSSGPGGAGRRTSGDSRRSSRRGSATSIPDADDAHEGGEPVDPVEGRAAGEPGDARRAPTNASSGAGVESRDHDGRRPRERAADRVDREDVDDRRPEHDVEQGRGAERRRASGRAGRSRSVGGRPPRPRCRRRSPPRRRTAAGARSTRVRRSMRISASTSTPAPKAIRLSGAPPSRSIGKRSAARRASSVAPSRITSNATIVAERAPAAAATAARSPTSTQVVHRDAVHRDDTIAGPELAVEADRRRRRRSRSYQGQASVGITASSVGPSEAKERGSPPRARARCSPPRWWRTSRDRGRGSARPVLLPPRRQRAQHTSREFAAGGTASMRMGQTGRSARPRDDRAPAEAQRVEGSDR